MQLFDFEFDLYWEYVLFVMDSIGVIFQRDCI